MIWRLLGLWFIAVGVVGSIAFSALTIDSIRDGYWYIAAGGLVIAIPVICGIFVVGIKWLVERDRV